MPATGGRRFPFVDGPQAQQLDQFVQTVASCPSGSLRNVQNPPPRKDAPVANVSSMNGKCVHLPLATRADGERCGDQPTDDTRVAGKPTEHGGAFVVAEPRLGLEVKLFPEPRNVDEGFDDTLRAATAPLSTP
jgi:hypothetical protein